MVLVKKNYMKNILLYLSIAVSMLACTKTSVDAPNDFTVSVSKTTFSVNDTVVFNLTGNPDFITFFSGMPHSKYQYTSDSTMVADSNVLTFASLDSVFKGSTPQPSTMNYVSLLASTNFDGILDSADIRMATWNPIATNAVGALTGTENTVNSIRLDTLGLTKGTTPLYLAFKYVSDTAKSGYTPRYWNLSAFNLNNYFPDTTFTLANNFTSGGFYTTNLSNPFDMWWYNNVSSITQSFTFSFNYIGTGTFYPPSVYPASGSLPNEAWAISRPFNLSQYPSDLGIVIKNLSESHFSTYKMTQSYPKPGTYIATFVARNQFEGNYKTVVRQITLTITP